MRDLPNGKREGLFQKMLPVGQVLIKTDCWKQIINYSSLTRRATTSENNEKAILHGINPLVPSSDCP